MLWLERWMTFHATLLLLSFIAFFITKNIYLICWSAVISIAVLFIWNQFRQKSWSFLLSPANIVSSLRFLSILAILWFHTQFPDFWIGCIALGVLLLDGLDGYLARRFNNSSDFGAYLDMETDAFYVFALSCLIYSEEKVAWWILGIGCLRYLYFLLLLWYKPPQQKESRTYFAQVIAVLLMSSLITPFWLPASFYCPILIIASLLVLYSFGKSLWEV